MKQFIQGLDPRLFRISSISLITVIGLILCPPITQAQTSGSLLSAKQIAELRKKPMMPVVVPTYLPNGFRVPIGEQTGLAYSIKSLSSQKLSSGSYRTTIIMPMSDSGHSWGHLEKSPIKEQMVTHKKTAVSCRACNKYSYG